MKNTCDLAKEIENALARQRIRDILHLRNTKHDRIAVTPVVTFFEGTLAKPLRHIATTKGHLVDAALVDLCDWTSGNYGGITTIAAWMYQYGVGSSGIPSVPSIRLGTGGGSTVGSTSALTSIENTPPNSINGSNSNPSAGHYLNAITATWNAGSLSAITVTEAGLWAYLISSLNTWGWSLGLSRAVELADRVSANDSDFASFVVNTSVPLSAQYQVNWNFV